MAFNFDDFFSKAVDGATGHADCLYCDRNSSEGGGKWNGYHSAWVCDEHIQQQINDDEQERQKKRQRIIGRFGVEGRGYLVFDTEPGETVEEKGETFTVASKSWVPGGINPNTDEYDPAGWYVKIK